MWPVRVAGIAVVSLVLAAGTAGVIARFFQQQRRTSVHLDGHVREVVVDNRVGDVTVRVGPRGTRARLDLTRTWEFAEPRTVTGGDGGTYRIRASCPRSLSLGSCSVDVDLTLPPEVSLDLRSTNGDVTVVRPDSRAVLRSTHGDVTVHEGAGAAVEASTTSGDVRLEFTRAATGVRASSLRGDVVVVVPKDGTRYAVRASAPRGGTQIEVPRDAEARRRLELSSSTGTVGARTR